MNILAVDSAGEALTLAVGDGRGASASVSVRPARQDEALFPALRRLLKKARLALEDLDAVAAASGPGRFTGIRIGMIFADMLARSLGKPALAISRLEALAARSPAGSKPVRVVLAGFRGEAYAQEFKAVRGLWRPAGEPEWLAPGRDHALTPGPPPSAADLLVPARRLLDGGRLPPFRPLYLKPANYQKAG